jgi:hypothetical protein
MLSASLLDFLLVLALDLMSEHSSDLRSDDVLDLLLLGVLYGKLVLVLVLMLLVYPLALSSVELLGLV